MCKALYTLPHLATIKKYPSNLKVCFEFKYTDANNNNGLDINDKIKILLGFVPI
jgi:hypothetical protein